MWWKMKILVILPCYNEEENLKSLVHKIDGTLRCFAPYEIIAVNDGSQDNTGEILKELSNNYPIIITEHSTNKGLSEALSTGIKTALQRSSDEDFIITMDADNTHDPKYILNMLKLAKNGANMVIGSRYISCGKQANVSLHRIIMSKMINLLARKIAKLPIKDLTSGYRCYRSFILKKTVEILGPNFLESKGFEASFELLLKTFWCCSNIKEIPIILDYSKKKGKSKMKIFPTIKRYCIALKKIKDWRKQVEERTLTPLEWR